MFLTTLRAGIPGWLVLAAGAGAVALPGGPSAKTPRPAAGPAGPGTLLLAREGGPVALTPGGKEGAELPPPEGTRSNPIGRLSPDGTRAAFVVTRGQPGADRNPDDPWPYQVVVRELGATGAKVADFPGFGVDVSWAPDGRRLAVTNLTGGHRCETVLLDPRTGGTEPLALPADVRVLDWSRDGRTFLVSSFRDGRLRLGLAEKGGAEARDLVELKAGRSGAVAGRLSPDGARVLFTDADPGQQDAFKWHWSSKPYVLDVATGKQTPLADFPENAQCLGVAWSPDGRRVAYTWKRLDAGLLRRDPKDGLTIEDYELEGEEFLIVADADGRNQKTVASSRARSAVTATYGSVDWR